MAHVLVYFFDPEGCTCGGHWLYKKLMQNEPTYTNILSYQQENLEILEQVTPKSHQLLAIGTIITLMRYFRWLDLKFWILCWSLIVNIFTKTTTT